MGLITRAIGAAARDAARAEEERVAALAVRKAEQAPVKAAVAAPSVVPVVKNVEKAPAKVVAPLAAPKRSAGRSAEAKTTFASVREGPAPDRSLAVERTPLPETDPSLPAGVTGSYNAAEDVPFTFRGKGPTEMTSSDVADLGDALGVSRLGPLNEPQSFGNVGGSGDVRIPGGLNDKFTYEDMMYLKGQGIDPSTLDPSFHQDLQAKLMRSMQPDTGTLPDAQVLSGLHFGITSPNAPLLPNQMTMSRFRPSSQEQVGQMIGLRPWGLNDPVSGADREVLDSAIAQKYGINAGSAGGLGIRGSMQHDRLPDLHDLFLRDPTFFHRGADEPWSNLVERVANQVPGLSNKTGSFGVAWQPDAGVSAVDRHMLAQYGGNVFENPEDYDAFKQRALALYQKDAVSKGRSVIPQAYEDLPHGFQQDMLLGAAGKNPGGMFRLKSGDINPALPEHLSATDWIAEPSNYKLMGPGYRRVVEANEDAMQGSGLSLFGNQWNIWDRLRRRLEPHENMFPGLELVPRPNVDQLQDVSRNYTLSGHKNYSKVPGADEFDIPRLQPTKPVDYTGLRYFAKGGPVTLGSLAAKYQA
jgi:hypothetical protein